MNDYWNKNWEICRDELCWFDLTRFHTILVFWNVLGSIKPFVLPFISHLPPFVVTHFAFNLHHCCWHLHLPRRLFLLHQTSHYKHDRKTGNSFCHHGGGSWFEKKIWILCIFVSIWYYIHKKCQNVIGIIFANCRLHKKLNF